MFNAFVEWELTVTRGTESSYRQGIENLILTTTDAYFLSLIPLQVIVIGIALAIELDLYRWNDSLVEFIVVLQKFYIYFRAYDCK